MRNLMVEKTHINSKILVWPQNLYVRTHAHVSMHTYLQTQHSATRKPISEDDNQSSSTNLQHSAKDKMVLPECLILIIHVLSQLIPHLSCIWCSSVASPPRNTLKAGLFILSAAPQLKITVRTYGNLCTQTYPGINTPPSSPSKSVFITHIFFKYG